jgi:UDP-N-acetylglucosamine/UDP-N-acetylgalactosamine diphosphorylase
MKDEAVLRREAARYGQDHIFRFWEALQEKARLEFLRQIEDVDFALMERLIETWIRHEPEAEKFDEIRPVPVIPKVDPARPDAAEAREAGEDALRQGRAGLFLVAGGQGTRLGFNGPKGAYPIGPITGKSFFAYHAEKIHNLQQRYGCVLPWYIMVSAANNSATQAFFDAHHHFGLDPENIRFITQRMVPCIDENGAFMLESPGRLAMNPNGHGGCIPAMVEGGVIEDARARGIDLLSYFQVDNWAVQVADPYFIGCHALANAEMSSKNHRKNKPREAVGVHCLCDGEYRVIEYTELDIYPQLLETDDEGNVIHYAGNPAIHILSADFVQRVYDHFDEFPWHRAHKKIPCIDAEGRRIEPESPNGYKFETFVFDALRFIKHEPVALEIQRDGEYTPIKQFEGDNSVVAARRSMNRHWGGWIEKNGQKPPRNGDGEIAIDIEISPRFAWTETEFLEKSKGKTWPIDADLAIDAEGNAITQPPADVPGRA